MKSSKLKYSILLLLVLLMSCTRGPEKREYQIMPDMTRHHAHEAQEEYVNEKGEATGMSMRTPVKGTIPRGHEPYLLGKDDIELAKNTKNPLASTKEVLKQGRKLYNISCVPCHGKFGAGDGNVITKATYNQRMPKPPELYTDKLTKEWTDGQIFHVITKGQGNMPEYGNRLSRDERWAIVHYVRAIQKAKNGLVAVK